MTSKSQNYVVRVHSSSERAAGVEPVKIKAESPADAAQKANGSDVVELETEEQHNAIAVVTIDDPEHESSPRYFGAVNK